jgi:hypothetical protein
MVPPVAFAIWMAFETAEKSLIAVAIFAFSELSPTIVITPMARIAIMPITTSISTRENPRCFLLIIFLITYQTPLCII